MNWVNSQGFPTVLRFGLLEWVICFLPVVQSSCFYCCFLPVVSYHCELMPLKNSLYYGFDKVQGKAKLVVCIQSVILSKNPHYIFNVITTCMYESFCSVANYLIFLSLLVVFNFLGYSKYMIISSAYHNYAYILPIFVYYII